MISTTPSTTGKISRKDLLDMALLGISFFGGFYLANTEMINQMITSNVDPKWAGIIVAGLYYFFKKLLKDNTK